MPKVTVLNAAKKLFLYESTIAEEMAMVPGADEEATLNALATMCGCAMMHITEELLTVVREKTPTSPITEAGNYIILIEEFVSALNEEERRAVIAHEIGHLDHAHLEGQSGIVLQLQFELEADQAAVKEVGKVAMAGAIVKLINRSHDIQQEFLAQHGASREMNFFKDVHFIEESRQACMNHEIVVARLAALQ